MRERTIWLDADQEVSYCPYCHSGNVWPCEKAGLWTCQDCLHDFIVRHRKPAPKPKPRAMNPEEFHALEQKARQAEEGRPKRICSVFVKGKYRELFTRGEPPSKDSLWELNNLVDIQETGIIGGKPIEQWIYPDGKPVEILFPSRM